MRIWTNFYISKPMQATGKGLKLVFFFLQITDRFFFVQIEQLYVTWRILNFRRVFIS